jgi:cytoskeletal protein CcmA (bactofilin family)
MSLALPLEAAGPQRMKWREKNPQLAIPPRPSPGVVAPPIPSQENPMNAPTLRQPNLSSSSSAQQTVLGRNINLHGQLSGSGDLLIEGRFDGTITLEENSLTVGPDAEVKAEVQARQVIVMGSVTGNITARDKVEIRRTGRVLGDLRTAGIAIEDGAYFKGNIEILRGSEAEHSPTLVGAGAYSAGK